MNSLKKQLSRLTVEELDEVIKYAKAMKQHAGTLDRLPVSVKRGTDPYDFILAVMANVLRERGMAMMGIEQLKGSRLYTKGFLVPIVGVHRHVESFAPGRVWQRTVYRLVYTYMIEQYRWGVNRMLASTAQIPRLLDEMLPGYQRGGLMPTVMEQVKGRL